MHLKTLQTNCSRFKQKSKLENPDLRQKINFIEKLEVLWVSYKMETQNVIDLLNDSSIEESRFATKKWYAIDSQTANCKYK